MINVIGAVTVQTEAGSVTPRSRKAQALLAYLVLSRKKSIKRSQIAGLVWSDAAADKASGSLRQLLKEIRNTIPTFERFCTIGHAEITIQHANVSTDIDTLIEDVTLGRLRPELPLGHALDVDLLNGLDDVGDDYQEWLRQCRADLERRLFRALMASLENERLSWGARETIAEAMLSREPLNETAHRVLIEAAARRGDTGSALAIYATLHRKLDEELGMEPATATQELAVRIKTGEIDSPIVVAELSGPRQGQSQGGEPIIAIMPFRDLTVGGEETPLGELIADDLICSIYALREIRVISSTSIRSLLAEGTPVEQAAMRLKADYFITGTIRRDAGAVRLSVHLVQTDGGLVTWADSYEVAEAEIWTKLSLMARQIAGQLIPSLRNMELRVANAYKIEHLSAYRLLLKAQDVGYRLDRSTFPEAQRLLALALQSAPNFAAAHVAKADWHSLRLGQGWSSDPDLDRIELVRSARTALRLGGVSSRALSMLGHNRAIYARAYDDALSLIGQAIDLAPNDAETLMWSSPTLAYTGAHDAAIRHGVRAIALSPFDPLLFRYQHFASIGFFSAGDFANAAAYGLQSFERSPNYTSNLRVTAVSLLELGKIEDARALTAKVLELEPGFTIAGFVRRQAFQDPARRIAFGKQLARLGLPG